MRVLIVPASRHGGTAEIGRAMASALRRRGFDVDVSQPEHLHDLGHYGAAIIGSGLYLGDWLGTIRKTLDAGRTFTMYSQMYLAGLTDGQFLTITTKHTDQIPAGSADRTGLA